MMPHTTFNGASSHLPPPATTDHPLRRFKEANDWQLEDMADELVAVYVDLAFSLAIVMSIHALIYIALFVREKIQVGGARILGACPSRRTAPHSHHSTLPSFRRPPIQLRKLREQQMRNYFGSASGGTNRAHPLSASPSTRMGSAASAATDTLVRWGKVPAMGATTSRPASPPPAKPMPTVTYALEVAETQFTLLRWPNPEVLIILFYSVGMVKACTAVLAAEASGSLDDSSGGLAAESLVSNARTGLTFIVLFMVVELLRLLHFFKFHAHNLWEDQANLSADDPNAITSTSASQENSSLRPSGEGGTRREREDPLLSALACMKLARRPAVRRLGFYRTSGGDDDVGGNNNAMSFKSAMSGGLEEEDEDDPHWLRVMQRLKRYLIYWFFEDERGKQAALSASWLINTSGHSFARGVSYQYARVVLQLATAAAAGAQWQKPRNGHATLVPLITLQILMALHCFFIAQPGDRLEALVSGFECVVSATCACMRYSSILIGYADLLLVVAVPGLPVGFIVYDVSGGERGIQRSSHTVSSPRLLCPIPLPVAHVLLRLLSQLLLRFRSCLSHMPPPRPLSAMYACQHSGGDAPSHTALPKG